MELPKNIVQIGKPDKLHRIFVEDYVISYIKQTNRQLQRGQAGVAFYGKKHVEDNVRYYFFYCAAEVAGVAGRGQYLSQMELEEIEQVRTTHFPDLVFLGWCTLGGEIPEGFFLQEQGKGLYISGYASFFEKNESMLRYMVSQGNRKREQEVQESAGTMDRQEALPWRWDRKREGTQEWGRLTERGNIDHRLEERSRKLESVRGVSVEKTKPKTSWKPVIVGVALLLCFWGVGTWRDDEKREQLQVMARQVVASLLEQQLPDAGALEEKVGQENQVENSGVESYVAQEHSSENLPEGQSEGMTESSPTGTPESSLESPSQSASESIPESSSESSSESVPEGPSESTSESVLESQPESIPESQPETTPDPSAEETSTQTITYVIKKGDTLTSICTAQYGSLARLQEVCQKNGIENADDIKVGQTILLPR